MLPTTSVGLGSSVQPFYSFDASPVLEALHFFKKSDGLACFLGSRLDIGKLDLGEVGLIPHGLVPLVLDEFLAEDVVDGGGLVTEVVTGKLILVGVIVVDALPTLLAPVI